MVITGSRAIKWQNADLNLSKSTRIAQCMRVLYDLYTLNIVKCTLWLRVLTQNNDKFKRANVTKKNHHRLKSVIKNSRWIHLIINAMKNPFAKERSKLLISSNECDNPFAIEEQSKSNNVVFAKTDDNFQYPLCWLRFNDRVKLVLMDETQSSGVERIALKIILKP